MYSRRQRYKTSQAFTYIEMLITVVIISVCFLPLMRLFSTSVIAAAGAGDLATAVNLGREGIEKIKNLNFTEAQLLVAGSSFYPPEGEPALTLNQQEWRIEQIIVSGSDPLEVRVKVFKADDMKKPIATLVTLIEDLQ
ncbi:MAG: hypothetical protein ABH954_03400 [Candidatus Omnitrophota bacterium]